MKLWNKIAQDTRILMLSLAANGAQLVIILGLIICIIMIPTRFTFHIPPDLSDGTTLKANKIPKAYVGQFTFYIWQVLNNWQHNGAQEVKVNLQQYGAYLSPSFKYHLQQHYQQLASQGQLQSRVRVIRPVPGSNPKVQQSNANTWQVNLLLRDSEYVNGVLVKDKRIRYVFKVSRFKGNAQLNPFDLVLDGFARQPQVVKTIK